MALLPFFLDTAFVNALVNTRDQWHERAVKWQERIEREQRPLVTTGFILIEIADGLAAVKFRQRAAQIVRKFQISNFVEVVPLSVGLYEQALELYESRTDKDWGLTDCASFVVMRERGLTDALTVDDHFPQAGFRALLLHDDANGVD